MKNDKKHIDRLFQEGLKNFEATPSHSVWENVSEQLLNNQEQRKVIPLWMKLSAIAASLVLLFTYECDLGDGWESAEVHNDPEEVREKALQMGANIINYVFSN